MDTNKPYVWLRDNDFTLQIRTYYNITANGSSTADDTLILTYTQLTTPVRPDPVTGDLPVMSYVITPAPGLKHVKVVLVDAMGITLGTATVILTKSMWN